MTNEGTTPPTPPTEPNGDQPTPIYKKWWFIVLAVIVGLGVLGSLVGDDTEDPPTAAETTTTTAESTTSSADSPTTTVVDDEEATTTSQPATTTTAAPTTTTTETPTTTATTFPPGPEPVFGSGTQVVGEDIQPGIYETDILGEGVFDGCYWERLSGFSGDFDDIIANNNVVVHDVVEIMDSDVGFDSDCNVWYELIELDEPLDAIPQGKWVVGVHFEAGTYQAEGGDSCYWERLSGVSGEFDDIVANDLPSGSAIVENGSDGVVRVSAANLNFCYARFAANSEGLKVTARDVIALRERAHLPVDAVYYDRVDESLPEGDGREVVPLAIPYNTAHSGSDYSVVYGSANREHVEPLLQSALETTNINTWRNLVPRFSDVTEAAREESKERSFTERLANRGWERPSQYDAHAQVVIRLFDEDGRPIEDYDIYFDSEPAAGHVTAISDLIEHKHKNGVTPNVFMFYLRTEKWDGTEWKDRFDELKSLTFSIEANEPETDDIQYVPFVLPLDQGAIKKWIRHHSTTVMDIYMRRVPSEDVFRVFTA